MIQQTNRHGRFFPAVVSLIVIGVVLGAGMWWRNATDQTHQTTLQSAQDPTQLASPTDSSQATPSRRVEKTDFAMGTVIRIVAVGERAGEAVEAAMAEMHRLTGFFDRFRPEGELFAMNQATRKAQAAQDHRAKSSAAEWIPVSPDTLALTQEAIQLAELTDGAFDPTVAPLIDLWGFVEVTDHDHSDESVVSSGSPTPMRGVQVPSIKDIEDTLALVDYRTVEIDPAESRIRLSLPGQQLDLGGIGKGYAADRAAEILKSYGIEHALIDTGGDIVAVGSRDDGQPWRLAIRHPRSSGIMAVIGVRDLAVATSGDYERYFEVDGTRYNHIIDPRTGWPASELMSVTVLAPTGVQADALATAVFVLGVEKGTQLVESLPDVEALLVSVEGTTYVTSGLEGQVEFR